MSDSFPKTYKLIKNPFNKISIHADFREAKALENFTTVPSAAAKFVVFELATQMSCISINQIGISSNHIVQINRSDEVTLCLCSLVVTEMFQ